MQAYTHTNTNTHTDRQTQTDTDRHRQTQTDRHKQTETDRQRQTDTDNTDNTDNTDKHKQHRHTDTYGHRQQESISICKHMQTLSKPPHRKPRSVREGVWVTKLSGR